jgi:hypothetical protein
VLALRVSAPLAPGPRWFVGVQVLVLRLVSPVCKSGLTCFTAIFRLLVFRGLQTDSNQATRARFKSAFGSSFLFVSSFRSGLCDVPGILNHLLTKVHSLKVLSTGCKVTYPVVWLMMQGQHMQAIGRLGKQDPSQDVRVVFSSQGLFFQPLF